MHRRSGDGKEQHTSTEEDSGRQCRRNKRGKQSGTGVGLTGEFPFQFISFVRTNATIPTNSGPR
jgi:hypothetical protein